MRFARMVLAWSSSCCVTCWWGQRARVQHHLEAALQIESEAEAALGLEHGDAGQQHDDEAQDEQVAALLRHDQIGV